MDKVFNNKKVLITGATGFIGSHVAMRLLNEGVRIRAFVRDIREAKLLEEGGAEIVRGDITDPEAIKNAVKGCHIIFHFAGVLGNEYKPYEYFYSVNVEGTRLLAEAALMEKVEKFIYMSTAWVYGLDARINTDEKNPLRISDDPYCDTKMEAEKLVRKFTDKHNLPCIIVQPTQVYGPGDETWTRGPVDLMRSYRMVYPGGGRGLIQPIYIDDLVTGIIAAARRGRVGEAYLLGGNEIVTIREFFNHLAKLAGRKWIPSVPNWAAIVSATVLEKMADLTGKKPLFTRGAVRGTIMAASYNCDKAKKELGFSPKVNIKEGMARIHEWLSGG